MRQNISNLIHQVDATFIIVINADMDMHAADKQSAYNKLKFFGQSFIAVFLGVLRGPHRKRVR